MVTRRLAARLMFFTPAIVVLVAFAWAAYTVSHPEPLDFTGV